MRKTSIVIAVLLFSAFPIAGPGSLARAADACPPPRCLEFSVPVPEDMDVPDAHIRVIVPAGYDSTSTAYPVLYLLHGAGGSYKIWTENTDVLALTSQLGLIVVMPDGGGATDESGWYSDWKDGSRDWESYHINVLIPYIEETFRTLGDGHRAIAGLSMGGYGAMNYASRHPGEFKIAAAFSGAVDIRYVWPVAGVVLALGHSQLGTPDDRVWGNAVTDDANWKEHNPTDLAANLTYTKLLIATGNGLPGSAHENPSNPGTYLIENGVWQMSLSFIRALDAAGVAHTDLLYGPGDHSWPYWRDDLSWALPQIMDAVA